MINAMDELKLKAMYKEIDRTVKNENNSYIFVTGAMNDELEEMTAYASMFGSKTEMVGLVTNLFLTICQIENVKEMLDIVQEAYMNALRVYGEQKNVK